MAVGADGGRLRLGRVGHRDGGQGRLHRPSLGAGAGQGFVPFLGEESNEGRDSLLKARLNVLLNGCGGAYERPSFWASEEEKETAALRLYDKSVVSGSLSIVACR